MRIAFVGFRGIPASYGGFETLVEKLAPALVERGHDVTVYCRRAFNPEGLTEYRGVKLITLPAISSKYFETISHTFLSTPHIIKSRYDAIIMLNAINALFSLPMRLSGARIAINVDGIERRRKKWNLLGRTGYAVSEYLSCTIPHVTITDAAAIRDYYLERYGRESTLLTYGGELKKPEGSDTLDELGLRRGEYFLYVGRFEPENHPDRVIAAHGAKERSWPLVMLGDNPYRPGYVKDLKNMSGSNIHFPGARYGEAYRELLFNAGAVVLAFEVGGTHPALVEAMGAARPILINTTIENREVAGEGALYFNVDDPETITRAMCQIEDDPAAAAAFGSRARSRMEERYTWNRVIEGYEKMLFEMVE